MFQIFMGNPSTSEGLSLEEAISTRAFTFVNCVEKLDIHVSLLRDKLHGTFNLWVGALAAVAYIPSISQSFELQEEKCTHVRDHLEYMGWYKGMW